VTPIDTAPLFGLLHAELLALLRGLSADDWQRPTVAARWLVRDVAAHLLDGDLRKIAVYRDGHLLPLDTPIISANDFVRFINGINASGVAFGQRLSPRLIVDLLEVTGAWVTSLITSLPLHGRSIFAVSWAGEMESENWMDTGREYTERWHHQMQIRDAVGAPLTLLQPQWMMPLLDIAANAWPPAYASVAASPGTAVRFEVTGDTTGVWSVVAGDQRWRVEAGETPSPECVIRASADTTWRLLFNALSAEQIRDQVTISGDASLAAPLLRARSVIV
jgi:Mycothiol maleylpyruvate isomerase N-terminal domain